jgi:N,N'-diacetyllegionaminate synthase
MTEVIAEIGWNHMGNMNLAKKMIEEASSAGASFAKFQTWSVKRLKDGAWDSDGRRDIYKNAELDLEDHLFLLKVANQNNIKFMSSVFSIEDAKLLKTAGVEYVKIPSFECRNTNLITYCNKNFKHIFMSTGTSLWNEIEDSIAKIDEDKRVIMHCISSYPCPPEFANLSKINNLKSLSSKVGYSDHVEGVEVAKASLFFSVDFIEKHFTLDKDLPGRDNKFSILPDELNELVSFIETLDKATKWHGLDYLQIEKDSRNSYAGRFDNNE